MKKLIFLVLSIFLLLGTDCNATNELWPTVWDDAWTASYLANDDWWQRLTLTGSWDNAHSNHYMSYGIRQAIAYQITGDVNWALAWYQGNAQFNQWADYINVYRGITFNPTGNDPRGNDIRSAFVPWAIGYSLVADGLAIYDAANGTTYKDNAKDILNWWSYKNLRNKPPTMTDFEWNTICATGRCEVRIGDCDQATNVYMGLALFAAAIRDEDLTRSDEILNYCGYFDGQGGAWKYACVGGLAYTGGTNSLRKKLYERAATNFKGGAWIESEQYSSTFAAPMAAVIMLKELDGTDYFPEITSELSKVSDRRYNAYTPDLKYMFVWGDTQDAYSDLSAGSIPLVSLSAGQSSSAAQENAYYFINTKYKRSNYYSGLWWLGMAGQSAYTAKSGQTSNNAIGLGLAYWHSGWNSADTAFFSMKKPWFDDDHSWNDYGNIALYRQGDWALKQVIDYYDAYGIYNAAQYQNTFNAFGGLPTVYQEARGQSAYQSGSDYMYHVGTAGGNSSSYSQWMSKEAIHEMNHSTLFLHNDDGSDTILEFLRLNGHNPKTSGYGYENYSKAYRFIWDTNEAYYAPGNFLHGDPRKNRTFYTAHAYTEPTCTAVDGTCDSSGEGWTWTAKNGETVYFNSFMDTFYPKTQHLKALTYHYSTPGTPILCATNSDLTWGPYGCSPPCSELQWSITLYFSENWVNEPQHQTALVAYHVGSAPTLTKYTGIAGQKTTALKIEVGTDNKFVLFNATEAATLVPPSIDTNGDGKFSYYDTNERDVEKRAKINNLRYFTDAFSISLTQDGTSTLYLADLNPNVTYEATWNGASVSIGTYTNSLAVLTLTGGSAETPLTANLTVCTGAGCSGLIDPCDYDCAQCSAQGDCEASAYTCYWWEDNTCHNEAAPSACDTNCSLCSTTDSGTECKASTYPCYWWSDDTCHNVVEPVIQPPQCTATEYEGCLTQAECLMWTDADGKPYHYWDAANSVCLADAPADPCTSGTDCQTCLTSTTCLTSPYPGGCYWWSDSTCHHIDESETCTAAIPEECSTEALCDEAFAAWSPEEHWWNCTGGGNSCCLKPKPTCSQQVWYGQASACLTDLECGRVGWCWEDGVCKETCAGLAWDVRDACLHQWKLNDNAANTTVVDSIVGGVDGTATDNTNTLTVAGKINTALNFNGTDERVSCTQIADIEAITGSFAFSAWVKRDTKDATADGVTGNWHWASSANDRRGTCLRWYINTDTIDWPLETTDGAGTYSGKAVSYDCAGLGTYLGTWVFLVATYDSATRTMTLYVNGISRGTTTVTEGYVPDLDSPRVWRIGYSDVNTAWLDGAIDNVMFFNRNLTATEVQELWNDGNGTEDLYGGWACGCDYTQNLAPTMCKTIDECMNATQASGYSCGLQWYGTPAYCHSFTTHPPVAKPSQADFYPLRDVTIKEANPTTNYDSETTLLLEDDTVGTDDKTILLRFDLTSIPLGSYVLGATLYLTYGGTVTGGETIYAYETLQPWAYATVSWNTINRSQTWGTAGGKQTGVDIPSDATFGTATGTLINTTLVPGASGDQIKTLSTYKFERAVESKISGYLNLTLAQKTGDNSEVSFRSSEATQGRPFLRVYYSLPSAPMNTPANYGGKTPKSLLRGCSFHGADIK